MLKCPYMCRCTPEIKTPFCGKGDCQWPGSEADTAHKVLLILKSAVGSLNHTNIGYDSGQQDGLLDPFVDDVLALMREAREPNQARELQKVQEAVTLAADYLSKVNEANSKLHCSAEVLYSPLTQKLRLAKETLNRMLNNEPTQS